MYSNWCGSKTRWKKTFESDHFIGESWLVFRHYSWSSQRLKWRVARPDKLNWRGFIQRISRTLAGGEGGGKGGWGRRGLCSTREEKQVSNVEVKLVELISKNIGLKHFELWNVIYIFWNNLHLGKGWSLFCCWRWFRCFCRIPEKFPFCVKAPISFVATQSSNKKRKLKLKILQPPSPILFLAWKKLLGLREFFEKVVIPPKILYQLLQS